MNAKTDVTKRYIDWAVENGFQVIDVNIPKIVAVEDVSFLLVKLRTLLTMRQPQEGYVKTDDSVARALQTRELATYLWDNYIE
jgi:histone deacetylase 6